MQGDEKAVINIGKFIKTGFGFWGGLETVSFRDPEGLERVPREKLPQKYRPNRVAFELPG
jgi:hypothetical protein